jgi:hypothetical protein
MLQQDLQEAKKERQHIYEIVKQFQRVWKKALSKNQSVSHDCKCKLNILQQCMI